MANWVREEIVIICSALQANNWQPYRARTPEAEELSSLLQRADFIPMGERGDDFRTAESVQRKMYDLVTLLPDYEGVPTKGGVTTKKVLQEFLAQPDEMEALARRMVQGIRGEATLNLGTEKRLRASATGEEEERMASKVDLRTWILEALAELGGSGSVVEVCRQVWADHEDELARSGDLFFTWQYDIRWQAQVLRDEGYLKSAEGRRGAPWELQG